MKLNAASLREPLKFPRAILDQRSASHRMTIHVAIAATLFAWIPAAFLSSLNGFGSLMSFLSDFAVQSRFLLVIPILIIAEPPLLIRLEAIVNHFLEEDLVGVEDRARFEASFEWFKHRRDSLTVQAILVAITLVTAASVLPYVQQFPLRPWCYGLEGIGSLSAAGYWYLFVGLPIPSFLLLRWIWRQLLWARFLRDTTRFHLQLIPAHPDRVAGLGFLETCLRKYLPFSFVIGTIVAGGVANRVVYLHSHLIDFKYVPLFVIATVLVVCVGPLCVFAFTLLDAKRQGIFEYGALAASVGHRFERKWLRMTERIDESALDAQDFSSTTDLYSIVANVHEMNPLPVGVRSVSQLTASALVPAIPVALAVVPFDIVMQETIKLLL